MTVVNMEGAPLVGVDVELYSGPAQRADRTDSNRQVNFASLPIGLYRIRFSGESVTTLERE